MLCHRSAVISVLIPAPSSFLICVLWLRSLFFFPIATPAQMLLRNRGHLKQQAEAMTYVIWDMGGQPVFAYLQNLFYTNNSVSCKEEEEGTEKEK